MLGSMWCDNKLDIQPCRSKNSVLKYISKEDVDLYTNVRESELNFNYQIYRWASRTGTFNCTDPFVVEHRNCYKFLEKYLAQHKYNSLGKFSGFRHCVRDCRNNWTYECGKWWNDWVDRLNVGKRSYKNKQLYLWGPTNVGKSTFIESLIGRENMKFVFMPGIGKFFMQAFNPQVHKVILFEEFNIKFHHVSLLKRLLEGRKYCYSVMCELDKAIEFNGPIIFVSNFDIASDCRDEAFLKRLEIVHADCYFDNGALSCCPLFKEEASDVTSEEVFNVSSETVDSSEEV